MSGAEVVKLGVERPELTPRRPFILTESYAHQAAKSIVTQWLRTAASKVGVDGSVRYGAIGWRVNRPGPSWGIWLEYPVGPDDQGLGPVWDEEAWQRAECGDPRFDFSERPPTYAECKEHFSCPLFIVDVAVQHKGMIAVAIEIVHKHRPHQWKVDWLKEKTLWVLEIPAQWVLGQTKPPDGFPSEFIR